MTFNVQNGNFKLEAKKGKFLICAVCNCCLYRTAVASFNLKNYDIDNQVIFSVKPYDGNLYICKICDKTLKMQQMACQAVINKLDIFEFPKEFVSI